MKIVVRASATQQQEWKSKPTGNASVFFINEDEVLYNYDADVYFDLLFTTDSHAITTQKPVFVNAVLETLSELPKNCIRINAWPGFLARQVVELVCSEENKQFVKEIMTALGWNYIFAPDVRGMVALRSIAMIINEAYFAIGDNVSTKENIDIAMKLGTNYPFGPFEWANIIGLKNIYNLLSALSAEESRYIAAPFLKQEVITT